MAVETWHIGVLAGLSALIVILIVIIIVLCCLWCKRRDNNKRKHDAKRPITKHTAHTGNNPESHPESHDNSEPNWILFQSGAQSSPVPSDTTRPSVTGAEPSMAGTSIVKLSEELDKSTAHAQRPSVSVTSQKYGVSDYRKWGAETNEERLMRLGLIPPRSPERLSHDNTASAAAPPPYAKPKLRVSAKLTQTSENTVMKEQLYFPAAADNIRYRVQATAEPGNQHRQTKHSGRGRNLPYSIPDVDYNGSEGMSASSSQQNSPGRGGLGSPDRGGLGAGKVKSLAANFETTEEPTNAGRPVSDTRNTEFQDSRSPRYSMAEQSGVYDRRVSNLSRDLSTSGQQSPIALQPKTAGANTIEIRVNKIKRLGGISVLPDL